MKSNIRVLAICWLAFSAPNTLLASLLVPSDFAPLGTFNPGADVMIDTSTLMMSGGAGFTGVDSGGVAVFAFDGINIQGGVTVTAIGSRPLALLSLTDVTIAGTLDVSGHYGSVGSGGAGGAGGGVGGDAGSNGQGPGGGTSSGNGGGGGFGGPGGDGDGGASGGPAYGDLTMLLEGGSGGGGATLSGGGGGGGGGGGVEVGAFGLISIAGQILADGGDWATLIPGDGGGGSGGGILLHADLIESVGASALLSASGGSGGGFGGGGGGGRLVLVNDVGGANNYSAGVDILGGTGFNNGGSTNRMNLELDLPEPVPEPSSIAICLVLSLASVAQRHGRKRHINDGGYGLVSIQLSRVERRTAIPYFHPSAMD